jgi:SAM-dependent methyltransferase
MPMNPPTARPRDSRPAAVPRPTRPVVRWSDAGPVAFDARQRAAARGLTTVAFHQGTAERTGLPDSAAQAVLQRALIHHLADPVAAFVEARRLLAPGGILLVQDRTMEDVLAPPSTQHLRGWFFELCPQLAAIEAARRPAPGAVEDWLRQAGFATVRCHRLTERRRRYADVEGLRADLRARTGRSILHDLDDGALEWLADRICAPLAAAVPPGEPVDEIDHWTVWEAR